MTSRAAASVLDRRSLVTWVMAGLAIYGMIALAPIVSRYVTPFPASALIGAILWVAYGALLGFVLYRLELFRRRPIPAILAALAWGALVVAGIGVTASPAANSIVAKLTTQDFAESWGAAITAPLVEEPLKALGIVALALLPGARLRTALDGIFYGVMVGLGFMVTESFLYGAQASVQQGGTIGVVVASLVLRGVIGGLWNHPTYSGIVGWGIGGVVESKGKRIGAAIGALVVAMVLHGFYDSPILEGNVLVATIVKGIPTLVLLLLLLRWARNKERKAFASVAESDVSHDLVSPEELETLGSFKDRRHAQKQMRNQEGRPAGHHLKRLQRSQVDLVTMMADYGPDHPYTREAAEQVRAERAELQSVRG